MRSIDGAGLVLLLMAVVVAKLIVDTKRPDQIRAREAAAEDQAIKDEAPPEPKNIEEFLRSRYPNRKRVQAL